MNIENLLNLLTPVILLISIGKLLNKADILTATAIATLKKLIVNVGLPAVMILSFLEVQVQGGYFLIVPGMFLLNLLLLFAGPLAAKWTGKKTDRFLFTGFEYGMLAYALFSLVYGRANIPYIALVVLGHELFIWFIYVPSLQNSTGEKTSLKGILKGLISSPIIIGIIIGLSLNILGIGKTSFDLPVLSGIKATLETLGSITGPLILLVLGAGLFFSTEGLQKALKVILIRFCFTGAALYLAAYLLFQKILHLPLGFSVALAVLLISPPPFVIPVFLPEGDDHKELNMVLALYTFFSLALFLLIVILFPQI